MRERVFQKTLSQRYFMERKKPLQSSDGSKTASAVWIWEEKTWRLHDCSIQINTIQIILQLYFIVVSKISITFGQIWNQDLPTAKRRKAVSLLLPKWDAVIAAAMFVWLIRHHLVNISLSNNYFSWFQLVSLVVSYILLLWGDRLFLLVVTILHGALKIGAFRKTYHNSKPLINKYSHQCNWFTYFPFF